MAIKYELVAKAGTFEKDGETKTRWHKCGIVLETKNGLSAKIESLPVGFDGWLNLWEPKPKEGKPDRPARGGDTEDVPFDVFHRGEL